MASKYLATMLLPEVREVEEMARLDDAIERGQAMARTLREVRICQEILGQGPSSISESVEILHRIAESKGDGGESGITASESDGLEPG